VRIPASIIEVCVPQHAILQNNPMHRKIDQYNQLYDYVHLLDIGDRGETPAGTDERNLRV